MKNLILILNAMVLILTISIVIMPNLWMVSVVSGTDGVKGISFPLIWTVYAITVFVTTGITFSWLIRR